LNKEGGHEKTKKKVEYERNSFVGGSAPRREVCRTGGKGKKKKIRIPEGDKIPSENREIGNLYRQSMTRIHGWRHGNVRHVEACCDYDGPTKTGGEGELKFSSCWLGAGGEKGLRKEKNARKKATGKAER